MSQRAIFLVASAIAAGMSSAAEALTPLDIDAGAAPLDYSAHAQAAPETFERRPDSEYEPTAIVANRRAGLQCVPFAREEAGVDIRGDASTWWAQARGRFKTDLAPHERAVLVLRGFGDAQRGHVAVVKEIVSDRMIVVDHANWLNTGEITRDVPVRDVSARGDWSEVQVWNIQTSQWGGRTYRAQGFILNQQIAGSPAAGAPVA